MRRLAAAVTSCLAVGALLAAACAPAGAASGVDLSAVAGSPFPSRTFVLTLPERLALTQTRTHVFENGEPVTGLTVVPNSQTGGTLFGTVLVIDASSSMHGPALRSAMGAARAFVRQHDPRQPLGIVLFARTPRVLTPLTTDTSQILAALQTPPPVSSGTQLYDAVQQAITMLKGGNVGAGAVVVLSDGSDTGSAATESSVAAAAHLAHIRIYSVGLRTRAFAATTLQSLATAAGGSYLTATKNGVGGVYAQLGTQLSNQYLVRYTSTAPLGSAVRVDLRVTGVGRSSVDYYAPALPPGARDGGPVKDGFWQSSLALALVVGGGALLIGLAILKLIGREDSVQSRVGRFVSMPAPADERAWAVTLVERALGETRRRGERRRLIWLAPTTEELELAQLDMTRVQVLGATLLATIVAAFLLVAALGIVGLFLALLVPYGVRLALRVRLDRQKRLFDSQLPDNLQVIASAMRAGHTFLGALGVVVDDAPEPSRREFRRVLADEQLGISLTEALSAVAARMGSRDFEHLALVATLQSETGGNSAEVIDQVTETIRERQDLRRLVRTLTAQGRLGGFVVAGLPVALLLVLSVVNPDYLHPMLHHSAGIFMLVVAAIMLAAGATVIKRIVDIDV